MGTPKRIDQLNAKVTPLAGTDIFPLRKPSGTDEAEKVTLTDLAAFIGGGGGGGFTIADNGLYSADGVTISLGADTEPNADPFTSDRFLHMDGKKITIYNGQLLFTDMVQPGIVFRSTLTTTQEVIRVFTSSLTTDIPWQMKVDANANGGPPDDLIMMQGWNIDGQYDSSQASWTTRMEYQYTGSLYEYHLQWSHDSRLFRLMSFTLADHAGTGDSMLLFFQTEATEFRPLTTLQPYFSFGNQVGQGLDNSSWDFRTVAVDLRMGLTMNGGTGLVTWGFLGSAPAGLVTQGFSYYRFTQASGQYIDIVENTLYASTSILRISGTQTIFESGVSGHIHYLIWQGAGGNPQGYIFAEDNGGSFNIYARGGWVVNIYSNGVLSLLLDNSQNATFGGNIKTAAPNGAAGSYRFGIVTAAAVTLDTANYIEVKIDGVLKKLALCN